MGAVVDLSANSAVLSDGARRWSVAAAIDPPSGTVTFLFTDVVGSTRLWERDAEAMSAALEVHDELLRAAIVDAGGYVFTTAGDAFAAAFGSVDAAVRCAGGIQARLSEVRWSTDEPLQVRVGLHVGEAVERGGDYFGPVLNTTARVEAAAQPGQVLATAAVRELSGAAMTSLGWHQLRDIGQPLELFQVGGGRFDPPRSMEGLISTLPGMAVRLVGRGAEAVEVRRLLGRSRLVTITGVGGCGKTRLAIEVGGRELPRCGAVFFADLTTVSDPDDVAAGVVAGVGLSLAARAEPIDGLADYLRQREALLILDNCEHVLDPVADLVDVVLAQCPGVRVLATSREALEVDGEQGWRIPSLGSGVGDAGFQLFVERARERDASFALSSENRAVVAEICERLDGIPLAIELAAARTIAMPVEEIRDRLDDRFRLLTGGGRRRSRQRQQTLASVVQWSHDLLDDNEKRMLRRLAVFAGGFDVADVASVTGFEDYDALDVVESLTAKSLIDSGQLTYGRPRLRLLETIRMYAVERLDAAGELKQFRDSHRDHYLVEPTYTSAVDNFTDPDALRRQVVEIGNICAAIDWAVETGDPLLGALGVARNAAGMNTAGIGHRYAGLVTQEFPDLLPEVEATLVLMRLNLATMGHLGQHATGHPTRRARELFDAGTVTDDLLMALTMSSMWDPDADIDSAQRVAEATIGYSDSAEATLGWMMAVLYLRQNRIEAAIEAYRRPVELVPQSRVGSEAAFRLCLLFAVAGRHDEADALAASLESNPGSFTYGPTLARAACHIGRTSTRQAAKELALQARNEVTGRIPGQEGEYLLLFAWFHHDIGNDQRAAEILSGLQSRGSVCEAVMLDHLANNWPRTEWEQRMRQAVVDANDPHETTRRLANNPRLLIEEINTWL